MLLFGKQMNDPIDNAVTIDTAMSKLDKLRTNKDHKSAYEMIDTIKQALQLINKIYIHDRKRQVFVMKRNYDKNKLSNVFTKGDKVVYYIGDRSYPNIRLRPRYSGPFRVIAITSNTATIIDDETGHTMVSHIKMLKLYHPEYFTPEYVYNRTIKVKKKLHKFHKSKDTTNNNDTNQQSSNNTCDQDSHILDHSDNQL